MSVTALNQLNRSLVTASRFMDYIPIVATINNIAQSIFKVLLCNNQARVSRSRYLTMLDQKTYLELFLKSLPILGQFYALKEVYFLGNFLTLPSSTFQDEILNQTLIKNRSLQDLPVYFLNNRRFMLNAAIRGCDVSFSSFFLSDSEFFLSALRKNPGCFINQTNPLLANSNQTLSFIRSKPSTLAFIPTCFNQSQSFVADAINNLSGDDLYRFMCLAQKQNSNILLSDEALTVRALKKSYKILTLLPKERHTQEFVLAAISNNGLALKDARAIYKKDQKIIQAACRQNPLALEHVPIGFISDELFLDCIERNAASWRFGSSTQKARLDIRLKIVLKQPRADDALFKLHKGNQEAMVLDIAKKLLRSDPYSILQIPHPYCVHPVLLKDLKTVFLSNDEYKSFLKNLYPLLSGSSRHAFREYFKQESTGWFLPTITFLPQTLDEKNLTGACLHHVLKEDKSQLLGYKVEEVTYCQLNTRFITEQKAVHGTGIYRPAAKADWKRAFTHMAEHATLLERTTINEKYDIFIHEKPFFASWHGESEALKRYYANAKHYLSLLAGYLDTNPSDKKLVARQMINAFKVCAQGIMGNLTQLSDMYCEFGGTPTFEYRAAKLIQRLAARTVESCVVKCYTAFEQTQSVHIIGKLRKHFEQFFLDPQVEDRYESHMTESIKEVFFQLFSADTILDEIYQEAKSSEAFKISIETYVKANSDKFISHVVTEEAKEEEIDTIQEGLTDFIASKDTYQKIKRDLLPLQATIKTAVETALNSRGNFENTKKSLKSSLAKAFITLLGSEEDRAKIPLSNAQITSIMTLEKEEDKIARIKDLLTDDHQIIAYIKAHNQAYVQYTQSISILLGSLSLTKQQIEALSFDDDEDSIEEQARNLLKHHSKMNEPEQIVSAFLASARDQEGHLTKESLIKVLMAAKVFKEV